MKFIAPLALLALTIPALASAQEAISTSRGSDAGPPVEASAPAAAAGGEEDPGDWARRVLAGQPAPDEPRPEAERCAIATDGRPHGEVWVGVGTRGYREIGGVVTQQIGRCGSVTIGVSKVEGPNMGRHSGRRSR
jgi:hypothetical protein